mgnify:CR=1 FL=1|jgi:hypothetical protein|tara:strand:- start:361 stop:489 length:129 start_codon:yes stop_codon:yes gene_type:complete
MRILLTKGTGISELKRKFSWKPKFDKLDSIIKLSLDWEKNNV